MDDDQSVSGSASGYQAEASPFRPPPRRPLIQRLMPVAEHVRSYRGKILGRDALAAVTVAALALPAGMAYAELGGLPRVVGLSTLPLPAVAYPILGSSRQLIGGPEGAIAAMVGAALIPMSPDPAQRFPHSTVGPAGRCRLHRCPAGPAGLGGPTIVPPGARRLHARRSGGHHRRPARKAVRSQHQRRDATSGVESLALSLLMILPRGSDRTA